jgi:hypothetical protein
MDLTDVLGSTIEKAGFDDHEFEEIVAVLLREEVGRRHRAAKVTGPVKKGKGDGGRDVQVTVYNPPKTPREDAGPSLTWDEPGTTWYSCKTTTRKRGWLAGVKTDVGWKYWRKNTPPKAMTRPSVELLQALAQGARYVVVINEQAGSEDKFLGDLEQVFQFWFSNHPGLPAPLTAPADFRRQLDLVDANHLAWIIRSHKPQLTAPTRDKLGAIEPDGLQSWESWTSVLSAGREPPPFMPDPIRERIFEALNGAGDETLRIIRVFGPPGVGKTRAVHEGLARLGSQVTSRVRYCNDIRRGQEIVESSWLPHAGGVYLVLDEAQTTDVPGVLSYFLAHAAADARLVLVGTSDDGARDFEHHEVAPFPLDKLDDSATRRLVEHELDAEGDPRVESVLHLSEGFPLFAVLLARALAQDGDAIERSLTLGTREWLAAIRVLAGPRGVRTEEEWLREAEIRAKCLLVVLLTQGQEVTWDDLWEVQRDDFAAALDEQQDWVRIKRAERDCVKREILRYSGIETRRYVSPRNLARIILNRFFDDEGPDLGPKFRRYLPQYHASLHALAERLSVRLDVRERLARGEWEGLYERVSQEGAESWARVGRGDESWARADGLYHAARQVPEVAAACAKLTLDALDDEALAKAHALRQGLWVGLQHLRHRKLSEEGFAAIESSLFRLSRFDREPLFNTATGSWQSLFLVRLDHTHHPWADRLMLLKARLESHDVTTRRLATRALGVVVDRREREPSAYYSKYDKIDAPWPGATISSAEFDARKHELWSLLITQCEDVDSVVAESARAAVAERFRSGVPFDIGVTLLQRLHDDVRNWTPIQRQRLSEAVAEFHHYDYHLYDAVDRAPFPDALLAIDALTRALEPKSFHERLVENVGRWFPGHGSINDEQDGSAYEAARDDVLVTEALEDPSLLLGEIVWLASEEAQRKLPFSLRLGERDVGGRFLSEIESVARSSGNLWVLVRYLEGWSHRDAAGVDRWLKDHTNDALFAKAVTAVVPRLSPSQARLTLLRQALGIADVEPPWLLQPLRQDDWLDAVPSDDFLSMLEDMLARPSLASAIVTIGMALFDRNLDDDSRQRLLSVLSRGTHEWTSDRIVMVGQPTWRRAIMALWKAGRREAVVDALLAALDTWSTRGANVALAEQVLAEVFAGEGSAALWDDLVRPMLEREPSGLLAEQLAHAGLLRHVNAEVILGWVGSDVGRGILAAHMVTPHGPELEELGTSLLVHFGGEGPVAHELHAKAMSSIYARSGSIYDFERKQLEHAEVWRQHAEPEVRRWAEGVEARLRASLRQSDARAELRRRYG